MKDKWTSISAYILGIAATAFLLRFELHTDDTGIEVGLILIFTFLLGCLHPRRAWQWALLVGLSIPAASLYAGGWAAASGGWSALVTGFVLLLGLAGSYAGAAVRKITLGGWM